jgi:hypothetical protein
MEIADRLAVLRGRRIEQVDTPIRLSATTGKHRAHLGCPFPVTLEANAPKDLFDVGDLPHRIAISFPLSFDSFIYDNPLS